MVLVQIHINRDSVRLLTYVFLTLPEPLDRAKYFDDIQSTTGYSAMVRGGAKDGGVHPACAIRVRDHGGNEPRTAAAHTSLHGRSQEKH